MKKWLTPLFILSALLALAGCRSTGDIIGTGLAADVTKIERTGAGTYAVTWRLRNPNVVSYVLDHSTHRLTLNGAPVGSFSDNERAGVPPQGSVEHVVTLTVNGAAAQEKLTQAVAAGHADYRVDSTIWLLLMDDDLAKYGMSGSGSVPLTAK